MLKRNTEVLDRMDHGDFIPGNHNFRIDFECGSANAARNLGFSVQYCLFHKDQVGRTLVNPSILLSFCVVSWSEQDCMPGLNAVVTGYSCDPDKFEIRRFN